MKNFEYKYLQINAACGLYGKKKGDIVRIKCLKVIDKDKNVRYIPVERYWRDRIEDADIDKCVEFVDKQEQGKPVRKDAKKKKS